MKGPTLVLQSRALQPFRVQAGDGNFLGHLWGSGVLPTTLWCDRKPSRLLLDTEKQFLTPGPRDSLFLIQPMRFLAVDIMSFSRYPIWLPAKAPTTMIYGFPTSFGKDCLYKNMKFFSWLQDKSQ